MTINTRAVLSMTIGSMKGNGFGLAGIQERARMLGGSCTVDSRPGHGTILTVRLALSDEVRAIKTPS
jgi:signal transduction histidine kinase